MPRGPLNPLVRHIRKLVGTPTTAELTDAELLRRFAREQDETAFALLVERHERLVWSVCRRLLAQAEDVEDAFQATLLVLARKAGSIRKGRSVASWLYGVAFRTALKTRTTLARRQKHEQQAEVRSPQGPVSEAAVRELQAILDEEVQRLPEKFRAPFVLCCLESKSKGEAAAELGWPEGSVSGRVAEARKRLQRRLARRGITLAAALCALALGEGVASAAGLATLTLGAVKAALTFAAGKSVPAGVVSARAITIAKAVLWTEALGRLKLVFALVLLLSLAGGGAGAWFHRAGGEPRQAAGEGGRPDDPAAIENLLPKPDSQGQLAGAAAPGPDAADNLTYTGQVLDADRRPRAGAVVSLVGTPKLSAIELGRGEISHRVLAEAHADAEGRFNLSVPRATALAHARLSVVAAGDGDGPAWYNPVGNTAQQFVPPLQLQRSHTVRGRLVDAQGQPAAGVELRILGLTKSGTNAVSGAQPVTLAFPGPGEGGTGLPTAVHTDAAGAFEVRGVGPSCEVQLLVRDDRFPPQLLELTTQTGDHTDAGTLHLAPLRTLEGLVVSHETGLPLTKVQVVAVANGEKPAGFLSNRADAWTDDQGRFRLHPFPGDSLGLLAYPPAGEPYLVGLQPVPWPDDNPRNVTLTLWPGVYVRGRVTEEGSGKPVAGATVRFQPRTVGHPILSRLRASETTIAWQFSDTVSGPDGTFQLAALPGLGHLLVKGPSPDYLHVETTTGYLMAAAPGGSPYHPDGMVPLNVTPESGPREVPVVLRRGVPVKGQVVGPDGQPVPLANIISPTYVPGPDFRYDANYQGVLLHAENGRFELPGFDPARPVPVLFTDPYRRLGARVEVAGGEQPTVRLVPCRSTVVRFVDSEGQPAVGANVTLEVVVHPRGALVNAKTNTLSFGYTVPAGMLINGRCATFGGAPGKMKFSGLIPGATYLILADEGQGKIPKWVAKKEFTVKPDEDPQLPDIVVQKPSAQSQPQ
jgi:RNA polymerase sigma factor (sigma-70 family)